VNVPPVFRVGVEDFGVRGGGGGLVVEVGGVVDDANCDVVSVSGGVVVAPEGAGVAWPSDRGHRVEFVPAAGFVGRVELKFSVSDGRSDAVAGVVGVVVGVGGGNSPPVEVSEGPVVRVVRGARVSVSVLGRFRDPDGDALVLVSAESPVGLVRFGADGSVVVMVDASAGLGSAEVSLVVSDGVESVVGVARLLVVESAGPRAEPDHVVGVAGSWVSVEPLANDSGVDGLALGLVGGPGSSGLDRPEDLDGLDVEVNTSTGVLQLRSGSARSFRLSYVMSSGGKTAVGWVRVDFVERGAVNRAPLPARDVLVVRAGGVGVVDVLGNDSDPDGDVLAVQSVVPRGGLVRGCRLRCWIVMW
jgi:hypothetical protein